MTKKILIVEDDMLSIEILKERFESTDYELIYANNGIDGLEKVITEKPALIISDLMTPNVSGLQMIKMIKANDDLKDIPIIACSALDRKSDIEAALDAGAISYIKKPYSAKKLIAEINNILS